VLLTPSAWATAINVQGTLQGGFDGAAAGGCGVSLGGLTYACGSFDVDTNAAGDAGIGGAPDNLGVFSLSMLPFDYAGHTFELFVTILAPPGSTGPDPTTLTLSLAVGPGGSGGVLIGGGSAFFTYPAVQGSGTFTLQINPLALTPGQASDLTGFILGATGDPLVIIPEPASMALMGAGLLAVSFLARRRRKG
jgi:hypothetical protein